MDLLESIVRYSSSWITWVIFIYGLILGSFYNVCIFRIPEKTFWKTQKSLCRSCEKPIPFYLNIPVLSYILLKGRARCCGAKISIQYPVVELITALLFVVLYWHYPFVKQVVLEHLTEYSIDYHELIRFLHGLVFLSVLLICTVIDIRHMIIPDVLSLPMIILAPLMAFFHPELTVKSSLLGILAGGAVLYLIAWIYWFVRKETGIGFGDVKLLACIGGWMGYQAIFPVIVYSSVIGAVFGLSGIILSKKLTLKSALPFGPFLALGALIHLFFGPRLQLILMNF